MGQRKPMSKFEGQVAVVTGGASGMGRSLVVHLARYGCSVATCDINMEALNETVELASKENRKVKITAHQVDVRDKNRMYEFAQEVLAEHGSRVNFLFANAGVAAPGELIHLNKTSQQIDEAETAWDFCFDVDYFGVLYTLRAFMPHIVRQETAHVVVTSSLNAFWTWPCHGSYTAAKFAVQGLTESLLCETYVKAPHVKVSCVHPGGIKTGIVKNSFGETEGKDRIATSFEKLADLTADEAVADWILPGVEQEKTRIIVGYDAMLIETATRLRPHRSYDIFKVLGKEGITAFSPGEVDLMQKQVRNVSLLGWLRIVTGGWYFLACNVPIGVIKTRRTLLFKVLTGIALGYTSIKVARSLNLLPKL